MSNYLHSPWTPELEAKLVTLWDEGVPTERIGQTLGVGKNAVIGKAHRLRLKPRPTASTRKKKVDVIEEKKYNFL